MSDVSSNLSRRSLFKAAAVGAVGAAALPLVRPGFASAAPAPNAPADGGGYLTAGGYPALDPGGPAVLNVSVDEFIPVNFRADAVNTTPSTSWDYRFWGGLQMINGSSFWHAGVHLPQGATVRGLDLSINPNGQTGGNTFVRLVRYRALPGGVTGGGGDPGTDFQIIAETPVATGATLQIVSSPAVAHVVDEANWNYRLTFLELKAGQAILYGARIGYSPAQSGPVFLATPQRAYDSRSAGGIFTPGTYRPINCAVSGVPSTARAVVLNITATTTAANGGYAVLYPTGGTKPTTSIINWNAGQTIANSTSSGCGPGASVTLGVEVSSADLIVDVVGYYP